MTRRVRVVTDSSVHFPDTDFLQKHDVVVVPLTIHLGDEEYLEGDITTGELFTRVAEGAPLPTVSPPSVEKLARVYQDLTRASDEILSIHLSGKLSQTWQNAQAASQKLVGHCTVVPIDSLTTSAGLGLLVQVAVEAAEAGESIDEIVRIVRGMIPRVYIVFFTEVLDYLENAGRIGKAQAVLGNMLGVKPFLIFEDGDLLPMEKVRTRPQAMEKLWEFICEFSRLEYLAILQQDGQPGEDARLLLERLAVEFPECRCEVIPYGPSLATFVGPDSFGLAVLEGENEPT